MKIFLAGGTGAVGRPLITKLLAKGHTLVALIRSSEKVQNLVEQGIEPATADVFDTNAVKAVNQIPTFNETMAEVNRLLRNLNISDTYSELSSKPDTPGAYQNCWSD
ncbi:MAG TPA: NAD(P)H-binding protein [Acidobacteriota bacterium]|nr:NAD(P)H-binding protein [Acidobacteriota bacterium]